MLFDWLFFISYLQQIKRKFHKLILFLESNTSALPFQESQTLERSSDDMVVEFFPKGSPELSVVEDGGDNETMTC